MSVEGGGGGFYWVVKAIECHSFKFCLFHRAVFKVQSLESFLA